MAQLQPIPVLGIPMTWIVGMTMTLCEFSDMIIATPRTVRGRILVMIFPEDFCGYKGNIIRADCADVARDSPCTVNPYGTNIFGNDCSSNYDTVRIQRYDFCAIPANKDEEVCHIFFGGFCRQEGNASQAICEETITAQPLYWQPFCIYLRYFVQTLTVRGV